MDKLSINSLLDQHVLKADRLPFGYQTGLLAKTAHISICGKKLKIKQENKHRQQNNLQSALNFLCVSDIDFILCIGYFFYQYPHRCTSLNILVSAQSAFNMGTDILVTCISGYGLAPTFYCGFIESQPIFLA